MNNKSYYKNYNNNYTELMKLLEDNELDNSIKFTKSGKINIGYIVNNNKITFYVKDTGIGIDNKYQEIIFDRFRQINKQTNGSGLGLSIFKSYVKLLDGTFQVKSKLDNGSTFYFTIPYNSTHKHEVESEKNDLIFIVEDNEDVFLYLSTILKKKDVKFIHAENGREAIDIFIKNKENIKLVSEKTIIQLSDINKVSPFMIIYIIN